MVGEQVQSGCWSLDPIVSYDERPLGALHEQS
jgi:hypothetical protein